MKEPLRSFNSHAYLHSCAPTYLLRTCALAVFQLLSQYLKPIRIELYKNKKQYGERPQGRTSVAEERQRDTDDRRQPDRHPDVYHEMEK